MNLMFARISLLLFFFTSLVAAANFAQCLEDFKANPAATGGVDSHGRDVDSANAVGLTYRTCVEQCGTTAESLNWRQFTQSFASWLLPWLALAFQLPIGSIDFTDEFLSVIMSIGSPALAAYSLVITSFNARMVFKKALRIKHGEKADMARALVVLQQASLKLTEDQRLLRSIPIDSRWKYEILGRLNRRNSWSLAIGSSSVWVFIAFILALLDSFVSLNGTDDSRSEGLSVGTLWSWMLCLVIGWTWVPTSSPAEVNAALRRANIKAVKTTIKELKQQAAKRIKEGANKVVDRAKVVNTRFQKRTHNPKAPKRPDTGPVVGVVDENKKAKRESIYGGETLARGMDEPRSTLPSPSSSAASLESPAEGRRDHSHPSISENQRATSVMRPAQPAAAASKISLHPGADRLFIHLSDTGSLHRDEFRQAAMFNYSRFIRYIVFVDDVFRALDSLVLVDEEKTPSSRPDTPPPPEYSVFPPGAFTTMLNAVVLALILQCGVTGAALIITIFTPTVGLGCRSLGYTVYGGLAIIIMFLAIFSTILARISETRKARSRLVRGVTAFFAIAIRRACVLLALLNSVGLIMLSCLQFSNFLANCYCNSSVIGRGTDTYIVIILQDWVSTMRNARIVGIALAAASISVFMTTLWFISALPVHDIL